MEPEEENEEGWNGAIHFFLEDERIKETSIVVASICKGHLNWTHVDKTTLQIFNVTPVNGELAIRLGIYRGPVIFRVHIIVYN